jgi:KaiC/GvpD/RAD55 family RecA-like ATPase
VVKLKTEKKLLLLVLISFYLSSCAFGGQVSTSVKPFFHSTQIEEDYAKTRGTTSATSSGSIQVKQTVARSVQEDSLIGTIQGGGQGERRTLQFSSVSNSTSFTRHIMCKDRDSLYNPIEPTTIFRSSDAKAICLTTASMRKNDTIDFRWYYRSNSSKTWVSCYNWSYFALFDGEQAIETFLRIAGYWPGINYPRAYRVEAYYLNSSLLFSEFFEVTNGGLNSPRTCEDIDAFGRPVNIKSRFTIGVDAKAYYYLRFDKLAYFNQELGCCHNFTTIWVQPDGSTYKTHSGSFKDYKNTNVTSNYWAYAYNPYDYISINSSTPIGNWKVELYVDSYYFNNTWMSYGPIATTPFVVGSTRVADWTFMVYLDADIDNQTNTEEAGIATFLNLASIGSSSSKVNVVVQMDRIYGHGGYGNWTDCKRFYVTKGMTPTPENATLDLGEVNMGDPETLKGFVNWTISYYPANHYCLVLWDHGAGVMGLCLDYTPPPTDYLSLPELSQGLSGLPAIMDVVLIDACSMGMIEVAYQIKDYANVLVGSEGLGYSPAPYNYYLSSLSSNSSMLPNMFAQKIVTDYIVWCKSIDIKLIPEATMSATDLTKIASLMAAFDDFAIKLKEKETSYHEQISLARHLTEGYPGPYTNQTGYYIDLYHFAQLTHQYIQDEELQHAADQLMTALSIGNAIIIEADKAHSNSHGLAIFFPDEKDKYENDDFKNLYEETTFATDTMWNEFVKYDLSGYVLTIRTPYADITVKVDKESYTTDAYGKILLFSLPDYHTINVTTPVLTQPGSRGVFTQWNDSYTSNPRTLYVSKTLTLQAQYKTQYRLIVGTNFGTTNPSVGEHWYDANSIININATASNATSNVQYVFDYWSVDGTNKDRGVNPITVTMDKPYEVIAHYVRVAAWWENFFNPEVQVVLGLASVMLTIILVRTAWIRTVRRRDVAKARAEPTAIEVSKVVLPGRITSGYADLDNLLFGGIPENYAVILTSPACDERDLLIKKFLQAGAKEGQITFYVTTEARGVSALVEEFQSTFYLFICNPRADTMIKSLPNVFKLKGVENLTEIIIALTKAFRTLDTSPSGPRRACIEIVSDVLLQHHAVQTRRWLTDLIPELRSRGFTTLAVMNPQMHPSEEVHAILDLFEGEINIYEKETEKGLEKFLKIKKMHNQRYLESEMPLKKERLET